MQQVLALAPDDASAKAARSLATPRPWSQLGQDGRAIWGACKGSGKDPYLTQVDWEGPAFKCSCPSRKFPCKHGLALMLLLAEQPSLYPETEQPAWVQNWIASRQQRADARETKAATTTSVDEAARAKRAEQRSGRVAEGIALLERWLQDLIQQGLASASGRGFSFWDQQASRLVDAQAPGLARLVRNLGSIVSSGTGWQDRALDAIGRLVLLLRAFRRLDELPAETQADVRSAIGFSVSQEDVLATEPVLDLWLVAAQRIYQEDHLRVQRTWLVGRDTARVAMLLDFSVGAAGFKTNLTPGTVFPADLCFFPGSVPQRAILRQAHSVPQPAEAIWSTRAVESFHVTLGESLAANPWLENQLVLLRGVVPGPSTSIWTLSDKTGAILCQPNYPLLALSAGHPLDLAGEWDGNAVRPLAAFAEGRFVQLGQEAAG